MKCSPLADASLMPIQTNGAVEVKQEMKRTRVKETVGCESMECDRKRSENGAKVNGNQQMWQ